MITWSGFLYAVAGQTLYVINPDYSFADLGEIGGTGRVTFAVNSEQLLICAPPFAYVLQGGTLTAVSDPDFLAPAGVVSVDGYAVFREADTGKFFSSGLNDFGAYDALDYATVEGLPGPLNGIFADHRQVLLTKTDCCELWENIGGTGFPFVRAVNGFMEMGCANGDTLQKVDNSVYMLASDLTVRRLEGLTWARKSQHGVEQAIRSYNLTGAYAFTYTQDGHVFYCLTFPANEATWCHDVSTGEWHERSSSDKRWRPCAAVYCYGRNHVQRYDTGQIGYLDPDVYTDSGERMKVEWTYSSDAYNKNRRVYHSMLECVLETGLGADSDVSGAGGYIDGYFIGFGLGSSEVSDPQILLSISNDGGRKWQPLPMKPLGKLGERFVRVRWWALGSSPDRVYRMSITDPVKLIVTDTELEVA
jgi:hypothetical protein